MTGPTRNRRRRGRRDQRQQPDVGQAQDQNQQAEPGRLSSGPDAPPSVEARRGGRRNDGGQQSERQGAGSRKRNRGKRRSNPVSYTHLRAHETVLDLVCRLLLEKK